MSQPTPPDPSHASERSPWARPPAAAGPDEVGGPPPPVQPPEPTPASTPTPEPAPGPEPASPPAAEPPSGYPATPTYGAGAPVYATPPPAYGTPPPGYDPGAPTYGTPPPYGIPPPGYGVPPGYPAMPGYGYAYPGQQHPQAVAALVCGIIGLVAFWPVGIVGVVLGLRVRRAIDSDPQRWSGRGLATGGLWTGIGACVVMGLVILLVVLALAFEG